MRSCQRFTVLPLLILLLVLPLGAQEATESEAPDKEALEQEAPDEEASKKKEKKEKKEKEKAEKTGPGWDVGFYGGLDLSLAELSGLDLDFAGITEVVGANDDNGNCIFEWDEVDRVPIGKSAVEEMDADLVARFSIGLTFARRDDDNRYRNRLVVRGLLYDPSETSLSASSGKIIPICGEDLMVGGLVPLLGTSTMVRSQGENAPYLMTGSADVEAQAWDLIWAHRVDMRGGWELEWSAGLRQLNFELRGQAVYRTDTPPGVFSPDTEAEETVGYTSETSGIGPLVGGRIGYRFGARKRFGVYGAVDVAGLFAEGDWSYRSVQTWVNPPFPLEPKVLADLSDSGSTRTITTVDLDLGVAYRFNQHFEIQGGYRGMYWQDVWTDLDLVDPQNPTIESVGTNLEGVQLQGLFVGATVQF